MNFDAFQSGTSEINGVRIDRVLRVSTNHVPNLKEDLSFWHWGEDSTFGLTWLYAYEEDVSDRDHIMPAWLLNLCIVARNTYGCNWILLDPDATELLDLPTFEHQ